MSRRENRRRAWLGAVAVLVACECQGLAQGERLLTANLGSDSVTVSVVSEDAEIDGNQTVTITGLVGATEIAIDPTGLIAWVTEQGAGEVAAIDLDTYQVLARVPLTIPAPFGIAIDPDGRVAYVGNAGRTNGLTGAEQDLVSVIDLREKREIATVDVSSQGEGPIDVAFAPDGSRVYAACSATDNVVAIDPVTMRLLATPGFPVRLATGNTPVQIAVTGDNAFVFVAAMDGTVPVAGSVACFDVATLTPSRVAALPPGANPTDVFFTRDSALFYVVDAALGRVFVGSVAAQLIFTTVLMGEDALQGPSRGVWSAGDQVGYVTQGAAGKVASFSRASLQAVSSAGTKGVSPVGAALAPNRVVSTAPPPPETQPTRESSGLCFVATVSCDDEADVAALRAFRDLYLMPTKFGRLMVDFYYETSPALASLVRKRDGRRDGRRDGARQAIRCGLSAALWLARVVRCPGGPALAGALALVGLLGIRRGAVTRRKRRWTWCVGTGPR